jgi:hypothetical protein
MFAVLVLLQVFCLTQVCPYVHFHHAHEDDQLKAVLSSHPMDSDCAAHEDHQGEGHSHECYWNGIKPPAFAQSRTQSDCPRTTFYHPIGNRTATVDFEPPSIFHFEKHFRFIKPLEKVMASLNISRAPPHHS